MKRLRLILPHTRKQLIVSSVIVAAVALSSGVYAYTQHPISTTPVANVIEKTEVKVTPAATDTPKDIEKVDTPAPQTATSTSQQPVTATTPATPTGDTKTAEDIQMDKTCTGVTDFISHSYIDRKDFNGKPWYGPNPDIASLLKNNNPAWYILYQQCVAAGKI